MPTFKVTFEKDDFRQPRTLAPEGRYRLKLAARRNESTPLKTHKGLSGSLYLSANIAFVGEAASKYWPIQQRPIMLQGKARNQGANFFATVLGSTEAAQAIDFLVEDEVNEITGSANAGVPTKLVINGDVVSGEGLEFDAYVAVEEYTKKDAATGETVIKTKNVVRF